MLRRCCPTPTETHTGPEGKKPPMTERWLRHGETPERELGRAEKKKRDLARDGPVALFAAAARLGKRCSGSHPPRGAAAALEV